MTNYLNLCKELFSLGFISNNADYPFNSMKLNKETIEMWYSRSRQRAKLGQLDSHMLRDIGLTCEQVEVETKKHFWQS